MDRFNHQSNQAVAKNKKAKSRKEKVIQATPKMEKGVNRDSAPLSTVDQIEEEVYTGPIGVVLTSVWNAERSKLMFTRIRTTNPENNKPVTVLYYRPEIELGVGVKVKFEFGEYQNKLTALNPIPIGVVEEVASAHERLQSAPVIKSMYYSALLEQMIDSPEPLKVWQKLGPIGQNDDLVYVLG